MKKRSLLQHSRNVPENKTPPNIDPSILSRSNEKYRYSVAIDYRPAPRQSFQGWSRYSVNVGSQVKVPKIYQRNHNSTQTMQNIRNTLNQLQHRIDSAKEELRGNQILGRSVIEEEQHQESRTLDLFSFNDSQNSSRIGEKISFQSKQRPLSRALQLIDLTKVKSYYKCELAKMLISGNQRAKAHLVESWKIINAYRDTFDPNPESSPKRPLGVGESTGNKVLVVGLDGTLIHCSREKKTEESIQVNLSDKGAKQRFFLSIRPHAISFLKKMSKKFDVVIFSNRSKEETNIILEQLDPLGEIISTRIYSDSCLKMDSFLVKDLRILNRDLSSVILVDCSVCNFLYQLSNGVPLLPYTGGCDSELYALQKYLEELSKSKDVRATNESYFQLRKYTEWEDPLEAIKRLYFMKL